MFYILSLLWLLINAKPKYLYTLDLWTLIYASCPQLTILFKKKDFWGGEYIFFSPSTKCQRWESQILMLACIMCWIWFTLTLCRALWAPKFIWGMSTSGFSELHLIPPYHVLSSECFLQGLANTLRVKAGCASLHFPGFLFYLFTSAHDISRFMWL